ncbi:hypothetical protein GCM10027160_54600 [Streptomyces calidiresistens]|uniref:Uncharacterized protein n=1 Tax=Streptomyces calidiresistens TaxID=1485586 RepID=A0A7W3T734_9ACTN|nr:hypothetical protein [Streptomyces calidiresistens]MBB0232144.1 hypothetical protein [Streptomyces calidiresistens]
MTTAAPTTSSLTLNRAPDHTYLVWGEERWESTPGGTWVEVPDATIDLRVGQDTPSYGAIFVATFSAEALASNPDNNGVVSATVFFDTEQAAPVSNNHRFVTARGNPEWSSHTLIRTANFAPDLAMRDVTARLKVKTSTNTTVGLQNWVLKIERYNT